jgi:hypothetical protein
MSFNHGHNVDARGSQFNEVQVHPGGIQQNININNAFVGKQIHFCSIVRGQSPHRDPLFLLQTVVLDGMRHSLVLTAKIDGHV